MGPNGSLSRSRKQNGQCPRVDSGIWSLCQNDVLWQFSVEQRHTPTVSSFLFLPPPDTSMTAARPSSAAMSVQNCLKAS